MTKKESPAKTLAEAAPIELFYRGKEGNREDDRREGIKARRSNIRSAGRTERESQPKRGIRKEGPPPRGGAFTSVMKGNT